jgi:hypothetical protein
MAWEFQYKVYLDLTHFLMDPQEISARISHLTPSQITRVGDQKLLKSGATRVAKNSVWSARLHEPEFLHSVSHDFGNTLRQCLEKLQPYGEVFREVRQTGYAYLQVVWFSDTGHSVGIIPTDVLAMCSLLNLDIDLEYYAPAHAKDETG